MDVGKYCNHWILFSICFQYCIFLIGVISYGSEMNISLSRNTSTSISARGDSRTRTRSHIVVVDHKSSTLPFLYDSSQSRQWNSSLIAFNQTSSYSQNLWEQAHFAIFLQFQRVWAMITLKILLAPSNKPIEMNSNYSILFLTL